MNRLPMLTAALFTAVALSTPPTMAAEPGACVPEGTPPALDLLWQNAEQLCATGWGRTPSGPDFGQPWPGGKPSPAGAAWNQSDDEAFAAVVQAFLRDYSYRETRADGTPGLNWLHDPRWRLTGDWKGCPGSANASTNEVHPAVRIHYSPEVMHWLCENRLNNPDGPAPSPGTMPAGALIVKEMQPIKGPGQIAWQADGATKLLWVKASDEFDKVPAQNMTWTIMAKGAGISQDDWFWGYFDGGFGDPAAEYNPPINGASAFAASIDASGRPVDQPPPDPHYYPSFWNFSGGVVYPNYGFGNYCIYCHGSAASESTFSSLSNLLGKEIRYDYQSEPDPQLMALRMPASHLRGAAAQQDRTLAEQAPRAPADEPAPATVAECATTRPPDYAGGFATPCDRNLADFSATYPQFAGMGYDDAWAVRLPAQTWDHHLATVGADGMPDEFMTSDQCMVCHDVGGSGQRQPNMTVRAMDANGGTTDSLVDLAEFGEWSASPMGLGGRDPIFYAMLESEINRAATEPNLKDYADCIQNTCLHCHGNQGQRQFALDHPQSTDNKCDRIAAYTDPTKTGNWTPEDARQAGYNGLPFLLSTMAAWRDQDPQLAEYGGLGRDGIACMTCHRISDRDLGQTGATFSGNFRVGPANQIYGPFDDNIVVQPMQHAVGATPMLGEQVRSSELCGSCHAIYLPVFDNEGNYHHSSFEQTTYLEWLNSAFNNENKTVPPSDWKSCQDCHMPDSFRNPDGHISSLANTRIANVQDNTFPEAENLLPALADGLEKRDYKRHTLYGLNVFMAEYFRQFPYILGVRQQNEMAGSPATPGATGIIPPLLTAREEVLKIARFETAAVQVAIVDDGSDSGTLVADVTVTNLGGHKLPSGVGFRRAFIEFQVLDAAGNPLWASGRGNTVGLLLDGTSDSETLKTEFLQPGNPPCSADYQPHYQLITDPCQVQIYEELSRDSAGVFTTSFIHRYTPVKDNRLLPRGYRVLAESDPQPAYCQPWCRAANPDGRAVDDPDYRGTPEKGVSGTDTVRYQVSLGSGKAASVSATLYSQATAPYFLNQRFGQAKAAGNDANARRLWYMTAHLNTGAKANDGQPYIEGYRLKLASDSARVD